MCDRPRGAATPGAALLGQVEPPGRPLGDAVLFNRVRHRRRNYQELVQPLPSQAHLPLPCHGRASAARESDRSGACAQGAWQAQGYASQLGHLGGHRPQHDASRAAPCHYVRVCLGAADGRIQLTLDYATSLRRRRSALTQLSVSPVDQQAGRQHVSDRPRSTSRHPRCLPAQSQTPTFVRVRYIADVPSATNSKRRCDVPRFRTARLCANVRLSAFTLYLWDPMLGMGPDRNIRHFGGGARWRCGVCVSVSLCVWSVHPFGFELTPDSAAHAHMWGRPLVSAFHRTRRSVRTGAARPCCARPRTTRHVSRRPAA